MSETPMPWVKMWTDMLDDPKMGRLPANIKWRFVELILLAGECDADGYLVVGDEPMSLETIAWRLRANDLDLLQREMDDLTRAGLIAKDEVGWLVTKFSKRQGRRQSEKREQWRDRKRKQRCKEQEAGEGESVTPHNNPDDSHAGVTSDTKGTPASVLVQEEEEEEEGINGAKAPSPAKKSRKKAGSGNGNGHKTLPESQNEYQVAHIELDGKSRWDFRKKLAALFCSKTHLPYPRMGTEAQKTAAQRLWWSPLDEIIDMSRGDPPEAEMLICTALDNLGGLSVADPNSIIKTARWVYANRAKLKAGNQIQTNADGSLYV